MRLSLPTLLLLLAVTADAFVIQQPPTALKKPPLHGSSSLGEIDEMCIENAATYCLENDLAEECDLEELDALVTTLKEREDHHAGHLETIRELLQKLNAPAAEDNVRIRHLSEIDELCVENAASYCLENDLAEGCDLEEYEALCNTLQEQELYHSTEKGTIVNLLTRLGS